MISRISGKFWLLSGIMLMALFIWQNFTSLKGHGADFEFRICGRYSSGAGHVRALVTSRSC
jgi:hypothetical protein